VLCELPNKALHRPRIPRKALIAITSYNGVFYAACPSGWLTRAGSSPNSASMTAIGSWCGYASTRSPRGTRTC
jgi:hypothetical protein